jgi:hypothetical protein
MLPEVLESVIFLETFSFVKWHYTELAHVESHTPFFVNCANTALPGMFTLHNFHEGMVPHITDSRTGGST